MPTDAQIKVRDLNQIVAEGRNDRRARKEAEELVKELQEERTTARFMSEQALEMARDATALVIQEAQQHIERAENANAQIIREAQQQVERAMAASVNDRHERERIEKKMEKLLTEVRNMKHQKEEAIQAAAQSLEEAKQPRQETTQARQEATQARQEDTQARQEATQARQEYTGAPREAAEAKAQAQVPATRGSASQRLARNNSRAVKWVRVEHEGGPLLPDEQARDVLERGCSSQAVNVLLIFGKARQGKSFLMNALTGVDDMFPVSPQVLPCTAGADLSPIFMDMPDFETGRGAPSRPTSGSAHPKIAFVDMEGLGDKNR